MNIRKLVRSFFGFSRTETNGFLVLFPIIFIALFSEPIYTYWRSSRKADFSAESHYLDSLVASLEKQKALTNATQYKPERKLFAFNPNEATQDELVEIGFSGTVASRIVNYRSKGGEFRTKKDLLKIYGMDSLFFSEVKPFILLPETFKKKDFTSTNFAKLPSTKKTEVVRFDLNKADTSQLKSIYGIGEKLSLRIIKYRESLGGFVRQEQLKEVFGLDSAVVIKLSENSFIDENFQYIKLNLNTATEQELDRHPYLNRNEAKAIVGYRFQHGKFTTVDELQKIQVLNVETFKKVKFYLLVE
jgi:competence protein ComEA